MDTNWPQIISDILSTGVTQSQLGELMNKSQAWVNAAADGKYKDLKWSDGERLRKIHRRVHRRHSSMLAALQQVGESPKSTGGIPK